MKHVLLCMISAFITVAMSAQGQVEITVLESDDTGTTLKLELYDWNSHEVVSGDENALVLTLDGGHSLLHKGAPDVPGVSESIIIDHKAATSLEVISTSFTEVQDVNIAPSKGNLYRNVDPQTVPFLKSTVYDSNAFWPEAVAQVADPYVYRDFRGQTVTFNPLRYNPLTKVLRVYSEIVVRVNHLEEVGVNAFVPVEVTTREYDDLYNRRFANYGQYRYDLIDELGGILVITHADYLETIQPWVDWKRQKGHRTIVTDIADINNSISSIGDYIDEMYETENIAFVQIVGDEDQVTSELVVNGGGPGYCDNCYGMITGDDHFPEVMVARFLVHNNDELVPVIEKTLSYDRAPDTDTDWASRGINIGSNEGTGIGDDDEADWQHNNNLKSVQLDFTYTQVYEMYDGSHGGDSPTPGDETADEPGSPSSSDVSAVINDGCSIINYTGHGYHNGVSTSGFNGEDALALQNTKSWPYFIAVACCVGDFDEADGPGDCFGEKWLKANQDGAPTGGIGGSFSSVLQSWAPPMEGQDEMMNLVAEIGEQQIRHTFAGMHFHGCASMVEEYGGGGEEMMDTWCLFGDGSNVIRTQAPISLNVTHDETSFIGVDELTISADVEDALIALTYEGEILGTGVISGGQVTITLNEPIEDVIDVMVTGTAFNAIPYQGTISILPLEGPWITDDAVAIDDTAGNDNDLADYAEDVLLDISLENVGIEIASGVEATLTSEDPWVIITDDYHNYGDIDPSNIITALGEYAFSVVDGVEDQHIAIFELIVTDTEGNTWTPDFNVVLNAPELDTEETLDVIDGAGNDNGRLDSGEEAELFVDNYNLGHATSVDAVGTLSTTSPWVTINNPTLNLGAIDAMGGDAVAVFNVTVSPDAPDGEQVIFEYTVTAGEYSASRDYIEFINLIIEDWETGDDESFAWSYDGNADWFVSTNEVYEGDYSMESGDIDDNQETTLEISIDVTTAGEVEFALKTSTEGGWDFLRFYVDNVLQDEWSGEQDWQEASFSLSIGEHNLRWTYVKDFIISGGADACWVDDIILPPHEPVAVNIEETLVANDLSLYPNPTEDLLNIQWGAIQGAVQFEVRNALGQLVMANDYPNVSGTLTLDVSDFQSGLYLVSVVSEGQKNTLRFVKE